VAVAAVGRDHGDDGGKSCGPGRVDHANTHGSGPGVAIRDRVNVSGNSGSGAGVKKLYFSPYIEETQTRKNFFEARNPDFIRDCRFFECVKKGINEKKY